jgi:hypothetical protein
VHPSLPFFFGWFCLTTGLFLKLLLSGSCERVVPLSLVSEGNAPWQVKKDDDRFHGLLDYATTNVS